MICQGFLQRRTPLFDKNVRKAGFIHFGAEGGIRTPARFYPPTPLAGEPLIATWVLLHGCKLRVHYLLWLKMKSGGESGIRTHGSFESPVFKTGSLNHSDISPHLFKQIRGEDYLTIPPPTCQELKWTGCPSLPGRTIGQRPGSSFQIPLSNVLRRRIFPSRAWSIMERNFSLSSGNPPFRGR